VPIAVAECGMRQGPPQRQHVVSQVLLQRFTDSETHLLGAYDLVEGAERLLRPAAVAVVNRFIRRDAAEAERLWQQTERRLPAVFAALDDRSIFDRAELLDVLRDAIATHWARSKTLVAIFEQTWGHVRSRRRETLMKDNAKLAAIYRDVFGSDPQGADDFEATAELIYEAVERRAHEEDFFSERVLDNYETALKLVRQQQVQIGVPETGEFLISDAPVVSWKAGHSGLGPLGGVPWNEADGVFLPLGPHHVAAMGSPSGWVTIPTSAVDRLNVDQIRHAFRHVCYIPESLTAFVKTTRHSLLYARRNQNQEGE
jgi:hypothetical protein